MELSDAVYEIVTELREISRKLDEVTEKLDSELNWVNQYSFARQVIERLDQIDLHVQFPSQ